MYHTIILGLLALGVICGFIVSRVFKRKARKNESQTEIVDDDHDGYDDNDGMSVSRRRQMQSSGGSSNYEDFATYSLIFSGVCMFLFLVMSYFSLLYKQDPGEAVVLKSVSGEVIDTDTSAGFGFKAPWVSVIKYDIRNQRVEMYGGTKNNAEVGPDGAAINSGLQGGANVSLSTTVRYSIEPSKIENIYSEYRSEANLLDREIKPAIRDELRNAAASYEPYTVKENRAQLALEAEQLLRERWEPIGIIIEGVDLGEMLLDEDTERAITAVNVSRQQVETARNTLDAARITAESTRVEAQAQSDADQIIRCGASTEPTIEVISGKEVATTKIIPKEGDDCEDNLNEQVLTVKWLQVLETLGASGNTTIVVPNSADGLDLQPRIDLPLNQDTASTEDGD